MNRPNPTTPTTPTRVDLCLSYDRREKIFIRGGVGRRAKKVKKWFFNLNSTFYSLLLPTVVVVAETTETLVEVPNMVSLTKTLLGICLAIWILQTIIRLVWFYAYLYSTPTEVEETEVE
jgi:hypothetical protein